MRSETIIGESSFYTNTTNATASSPPASDVWSTERRLLEKLPPGAPRRRRSSPPSRQSSLSHKKHRTTDRLLLPSRTIDEEDDDDDDVNNNNNVSDDDNVSVCGTPHVSLRFRPTRLFFDNVNDSDIASFRPTSMADPTTVLLLPDFTFPWGDDVEDNDNDDDDDDDMALSPRLFRFGRARLSRFEAIDVAAEADDESDHIFRQEAAALLEGRCDTTTILHNHNNTTADECLLLSWAPTMGQRSPDDDDERI